jgi:hypothetical protein
MDAIDRHFSSATHRQIQMISLSRMLTQLLGSMWWSLVEFNTETLATSGHPVVLWRFSHDLRIPGTGSTEGVLDTLEVRVPITPTQALLMTWHDEPDDEGARIEGARVHARNFNAFTIANADRQWFCKPHTTDIRPVHAAFHPLSQAFFLHYDADAARKTRRFQWASRALSQGRPDRFSSDIEIAFINRAT